MPRVGLRRRFMHYPHKKVAFQGSCRYGNLYVRQDGLQAGPQQQGSEDSVDQQCDRLDAWNMISDENVLLKLAVVCPAFNEDVNLPVLYMRLIEVVEGLPYAFRFIFVNDGSVDGTEMFLRDLAKSDSRVLSLMLSRNFGHQAALMAGINAGAHCDALILMDADLQDSPEAIPQFVNQWRAGSDVVFAVRVKRKEAWWKRLAFGVFYRTQKLLVGVPMPTDAGIFCLISKRVVQALQAMPERNRYFPGLRAYAGFRQCGVPVERGARLDGAPRVSVFGLFRLALDAIFAFSNLPLRAITCFGAIVALVSFLLASYGLVARFVFSTPLLDWPFGLSTTLFFGGVQLVSIGILGEYIGRIYDEVKRRPSYIVAEAVGSQP